ncbi:MAG: hypothetical protein ABEN55_02050 [Bradymonadaceae bacterium]
MRREIAAVGLVVFAAAVALPTPAAAGGFVGPQGHVWAKLGYRVWSADRTFAGPNDRDTSSGVELGDRIAFDSTTGGQMRMRALETQIVGVPLPRLRTSLYMPVVQQIRFENRNFETVTTGSGDIRPAVGYQLTPDGIDVGTTVNLRAKIPTTARTVDAASVPLSEGQFDLAVDQTTTWAPIERLHLTLRTMFRYRAPGELPETGERYKPGDETVVAARIGGQPIESVWLAAGYRGLWSTGWESRTGGTAGRSEFRMVQNATASVYWSWGDLVGGAAEGFAVDLSATWPWTGRDYPAGPSLAAALAWEL